MNPLSPEALTAVQLTLELAAITTVVLMIVATPIAWRLARARGWWAEVVGSIVALPLVLPPTVLGFLCTCSVARCGRTDPEGPWQACGEAARWRFRCLAW